MLSCPMFADMCVSLNECDSNFITIYGTENEINLFNESILGTDGVIELV